MISYHRHNYDYPSHRHSMYDGGNSDTLSQALTKILAENQQKQRFQQANDEISLVQSLLRDSEKGCYLQDTKKALANEIAKIAAKNLSDNLNTLSSNPDDFATAIDKILNPDYYQNTLPDYLKRQFLAIYDPQALVQNDMDQAIQDLHAGNITGFMDHMKQVNEDVGYVQNYELDQASVFDQTLMPSYNSIFNNDYLPLNDYLAMDSGVEYLLNLIDGTNFMKNDQTYTID